MAKMIIMYATTKHGEGFVHEVGKYKSIEDISIDVGVFDRDVQITFEYETKNNDD